MSLRIGSKVKLSDGQIGIVTKMLIPSDPGEEIRRIEVMIGGGKRRVTTVKRNSQHKPHFSKQAS